METSFFFGRGMSGGQFCECSRHGVQNRYYQKGVRGADGGAAGEGAGFPPEAGLGKLGVIGSCPPRYCLVPPISPPPDRDLLGLKP